MIAHADCVLFMHLAPFERSQFFFTIFTQGGICFMAFGRQASHLRVVGSTVTANSTRVMSVGKGQQAGMQSRFVGRPGVFLSGIQWRLLF